MKLYHAPKTRSVRSAWLMHELGLDFDLRRFEGVGDPAMRDPDFLKISPNGRVPVLEDGDVRLFESAAIAEYLVARHGGGRLAPDVSSPEFPAYLQWLHYGEGMIMGPVNNYVVETVILKPERRSEEHVNRALRLMAKTLHPVDAHLEGRDYLAGEFTAADTITGHACIVCKRIGIDFASMPRLREYVERLESRPALRKALSI